LQTAHWLFVGTSSCLRRVYDNHPVTSASADQGCPVSPEMGATMAFGIRSNFGLASTRPALFGIALRAALGRAWRHLRKWLARSRERDVLADLDDRLLHDIGVLRDRDIGVSREAAAREVDRQVSRLPC
jgi:uncharacterized protein YjiS (DUF1127 family)